MMANRYAVKSGNWSDPTVWDGGTLPGVDDVVRPNGFTVEIDGQPVLLASYVDNSPPPEHVREGTVYGPASSLTGTMHIPAATDVANGVAVDDTVGTAVATSEDVWEHDVTTGVSAASRLLATSTPNSVGAQLEGVTNGG